MPGTRATYPIIFALTLLAFLALDGIWLTLMASRLYRPAIGHLMRPDFAVGAAALFYLLYTAAMVHFVVRPARNLRDVLLRGAFFGLVAYGTYDLTNQATLTGWPWQVTLADLVWGAFVTASSCAFAFTVMRRRRG